MAIATAAAAKTDVMLYNKTGSTITVKTDPGRGDYHYPNGDSLLNDHRTIYALNLSFALPDGSVATIVDTGNKDANGDWIIRSVVMQKLDHAPWFKTVSTSQIAIDIPWGHYGCVDGFIKNENVGKSTTPKYAVQFFNETGNGDHLNTCEK